MRTLIGLLGAAALAAPGVASAQSYRTLVESRRLDQREGLRVEVDFAVGRFQLAPADGRQLYRVGLTYIEEQFDPAIAYHPELKRLTIDLKGRERHVDFGDIRDTRQRLDLRLAPEVPLDLDLTFGAVQADIELGGLTLRSAAIGTGASETTVQFSAANQAACDGLTLNVGAAEFTVIGLGNSRCRVVDLKGGVGDITLDFSGAWPAGAEMRVNADIGLGAVTLRVPESVGVRLNVDRFLASLDLDGFTKRGGVHFSDGYDAAAVKLIVDVNAALGSIRVDWIR
jgi:hypothetical protein